MVIHSIELCAGVGMLGEGVRAALEFYGWQHRTVAYVERETAAAAQLVALMESECLDAAPIWPDLTTFDGAAWRGKVDCVIAGFPCQDMSVAGKRVGLDGARSGLFFNVCQIADDCGAWLLILENVAGIASATASVVDEAEGELDERAASRVVGELADRGWNAEWLHLSASDVGASHGRERWFCFAWRMAHTEDKRASRGSREVSKTHWRPDSRLHAEHCDTSSALGDPRLQHQHLQQREDGAEHSGAGGCMADFEIIGQRPGVRRHSSRKAGRETKQQLRQVANASVQGLPERTGGGRRQ
jgi:DNA (cytosine-5)-methyltransferase 1